MDVRFPKQYLVSIILPTRKRVKDLHETLQSILDNANPNNKNFEIILKVDYDDQETINYINQFTNQNDNINVILASRLEGWFSLVDFIETMIDVSKGKYIWNINDDSRILTPNWNDIFFVKLLKLVAWSKISYYLQVYCSHLQFPSVLFFLNYYLFVVYNG